MRDAATIKATIPQGVRRARRDRILTGAAVLAFIGLAGSGFGVLCLAVLVAWFGP